MKVTDYNISHEVELPNNAVHTNKAKGRYFIAVASGRAT
jgi:hypothetical protein